MKFFFIKSTYKRVEELYWLGKAEANEQICLSKDKVIGEFIILGFYRLMGIPTPKTYLGENEQGYVLISKLMKNWTSLRLKENFEETPCLPSSLTGLAEFELASAVLSDIDASGWIFDNIGKKDKDKKFLLTKLDGGTHVLNQNKVNFYKEFFRISDQIDQFPEGISTLSDDDNLNHTYLKIFLVENITKYNQHYKHLFDSITKDQRIQALNKLQNISRNDLELLLGKIPEDWMAQDRKKEILDYLENRINAFKNKFKKYISEESKLEKTANQSSNYFFQKLLSQKSVVKSNWQQKYTLDPNYADEKDWSQSGAGHKRYTKSYS
ncbi:Uncharacterised protein [Legionella busanensis]|uniref:Uncharacterized protein n=1 Tax=Legionella busanensis TaxID=190655 RepID=A0A378JVX0_9GAMM|nr:hypothetical protein [Legionella busanensis]STX52352.1 Uncharacterised protein [Legionella busanensis]